MVEVEAWGYADAQLRRWQFPRRLQDGQWGVRLWHILIGVGGNWDGGWE